MNFFRFVAENYSQIGELTAEHLWMVGLSTLLAMLIGIPAGIVIAHRLRLSAPVLASVT